MIGQIFHEAMYMLTDISSQLAEWEQMIEHISARANGWLTFATVCGWIGFGLSMVATVYLFVIAFPRKEGKHGKRDN